ncbi:unnamed protein product [Vitrella brassicaformis CCMP3155]|uniref:20S-pre-rRNA D-site endonuclease NOB1 n=2 Tax=Vitrella brassicaformis TaxID=1169539 RepID=A0A0G4F2C4_VITBC|nr:unnamed protein product [Vitrella brassicaformis CCMP3155]|eukprot:CEM05841.1 unnamed protein product [Vitrella brassicaformis CCMP3155]
MASPPVTRQVVLDTGALIRLKRVEKAGGQLYTTAAVMNEVKDPQARMHLDTMTEPIVTRQPTEADVKFVRYFASLTGDFPYLSSTDIQVIALTLMLQRETGDISLLRSKPKPLTFDSRQAAFHWNPPKPADTGQADSSSRVVDGAGKELDSEPRAPAEQQVNSIEPTDGMDAESGHIQDGHAAAEGDGDRDDDAACYGEGGEHDEADDLPTEEAAGDECEEGDTDDDNDEEGEWVTSDNIHRFGMAVKPDSAVRVACVTTDYSMQNVLLQMGLHILTIDGYVVRNVKLWGLICRACYEFTRDTNRRFCPKCGNNTVQRVPITVNDEGEVSIHDNRKRNNLKGTIFDIPKPKGGRQQHTIIFAEDEMMIGGRDRLMRRQMKIQQKEKAARNPFNEDIAYEQRGWWKRTTLPSGKLAVSGGPTVQVGFGRGNPNSNRWQKRHRNKK